MHGGRRKVRLLLLIGLLLFGNQKVLMADEWGGFDIEVNPEEPGAGWDEDTEEQNQSTYMEEISHEMEEVTDPSEEDISIAEELQKPKDDSAEEMTEWKEETERDLEDADSSYENMSAEIKQTDPTASSDTQDNIEETPDIPNSSKKQRKEKHKNSEKNRKSEKSNQGKKKKNPMTLKPEAENSFPEGGSQGLLFYDSNHDSDKDAEREKKKELRFGHEKSCRKGEMPEIKMNSESSVQILSVRVNEKECSWRWTNAGIALEEVYTGQKMEIELIAVADGTEILEMDPWIF